MKIESLMTPLYTYESEMDTPLCLINCAWRKGWCDLQRQSGITLMEVLTVIAIIGILSAIAVPDIIDWLPRHRLANAVSDIKSAIKFSQATAIKQNGFVTITFATDTITMVAHAWSYADAANRLAATGFTSDQIGKLARQKDDNSFWKLTVEAPPTWVEDTNAAALKIVSLPSDVQWIDGTLGGTLTMNSAGWTDKQSGNFLVQDINDPNLKYTMTITLAGSIGIQ